MNNNDKPLDRDETTNLCLSLLTSLTASANGQIRVADFCRKFDIGSSQFERVFDLLQSIADERTGARIAITRDEDDVSLMGNAGALAPVRLTGPEALALNQALERCKLDNCVRERIAAALAPITRETEGKRLLSGDALFGGFYPVIVEAIAYGIRLRVTYRAASEDAPRERIIDPGYIEVAGDAAYLVAWNVAKDGQRSYRLDRIDSVELTEDSVLAHPFVRLSAAESLQKHGSTARMRWSSQAVFDACTWAGIDRGSAIRNDDGTMEANVSYTSAPWLFDQVLGAGGEIVIESPDELRAALVSYAQ